MAIILNSQMMKFARMFASLAATDMEQKARSDFQNYQKFLQRIELHAGNLQALTVLDLGCGRFFPISILLHCDGIDVIGADIAHIGIDEWLGRRWWCSWRAAGLYGLAREVLLDLFGKGTTYYRLLRQISGRPLQIHGLDIRRMDACQLLLANNSVDIVLSVAVFEHVADVRKATNEVHRVLRPGGLAYLAIDVFTSIGGSHNPLWHDVEKVPPWDHLRQRTWPLPTYLNRLRLNDYLSVFKERFEILSMDFGDRSGSNLLTPETRAELSKYSEEELLVSPLTLILKRRGH